jgi:ACS family glucarate transporter-like MFS transporter
MSSKGQVANTPDVPEARVLEQKRSNYRWTMAIFAMLGTFMAYMDRVNLSVATPAIMKELHFTKMQIGTLQTLFFVCYALCQIPSGMIADRDRFGHRKIVPLALGFWSIFTTLTAFCQSFTSWVVVRVLFGVGEAPLYPGLTAALAKWFPKRERGKAVGLMIMGARFGPLVGMPLAVLIMIRWGWRSVFVSFGVIGVVIAVAYYLLLRTYPRESKYVNQAELDYIADGQIEATPTQKKASPPWKDFLSSGQFWAIGGQFAMGTYINYMFIAWLPVYLLEVHHFSFKQMGFTAAIPELGYALGNIFCGVACDYLIGRKLAGAKSRAWFAGIAMLLCCGGLYLTATSPNRWITVMWLTFALFCLGINMNSAWTTCTHIAQNFAGTVSGWMNFCGNLFGALAPIVTAWVATRYGWQSAILVTAIVGMLGGVCWIFVKPDVPLTHRAPAQFQTSSQS